MKRILFIILTILCVGQLSAQNRVSQIREKLLTHSTKSVIVVSHRGDWRNFPENSLEAIDNAIKMGVDIVEIDIKRTADGQLILMHDHSLNRTTTGKGLVSDCTLDSIRTLHLKNGCNIRTIHKVPTLEEALLHAKGKIMLNLDQADSYFDQIYTLLKKTGTQQQIIMKGRKSPAEVKKQFGAYLKDVIYMPIVDLDKEGAEEQIETFISELHPVAFELLFVKDSNTLPLRLANKLSRRALIWYNTLWDTMAGGHDDDMSLANPSRGYGYLIDKLNCRIIQTDRPAYLINYLRQRKLHR